MKKIIEKEYFTLLEISKKYGVPARIVGQWVKEGGVPYLYPKYYDSKGKGGQRYSVLVHKDDVENMFEVKK